MSEWIVYCCDCRKYIDKLGKEGAVEIVQAHRIVSEGHVCVATTSKKDLRGLEIAKAKDFYTKPQERENQ